MKDLQFRFAQREDISLILKFIKDLAQYEGLLEEVTATEEVLEYWLFDEKKAEVLFVVKENTEVGFALFFHNFSTFLGKSGIYLEDLYVVPAQRGKGIGTAILQQLAVIAKSRGCGRLEWWCLDQNTPSIQFYLSKGAKAMDQWTVYRITGETLNDLAQQSQNKT